MKPLKKVILLEDNVNTNNVKVIQLFNNIAINKLTIYCIVKFLAYPGRKCLPKIYVNDFLPIIYL